MSVFEVQARTPLGKWISILRYGCSPLPAKPCAIDHTARTVLPSVAQHDAESVTAQYQNQKTGSTRLGTFVDVYC